MVHRKRVRERPRDAVGASEGGGLPADHARGGGGRGGGGGRATAVPGYMRATSSSGAKAAVGGEVAAPPEREVVRGVKVAFAGTPSCASRATCSSAMKGTAAAAGRVCPYAYCSLKGHVHAPVVSLKSFLASERRRLIKTQQSMKQKGVSPFRLRASNGGVGADGFFVEVFTGATASTASSDVACSDISTEEVDATMVSRRMEYVTFDRRSCRDDAEDKVKEDLDVSVEDGSCGSSDVISDGLAEVTSKFRCRRGEIAEDEEASVDQEAQDFGACKSDISEDRGGAASVESSMDDISSAFGGMNFENVGSDPVDAATYQRNKLIISRRGTPKEAERIRTFRPRAPNFLPVEPDPDAEKVDLRHQMTDDRKSAEEWMVDYALRRQVSKLARAQKRKVEMLVMAFETVLPPASSEKSGQQDDNKKNFTQTRNWQACN